MDHGSVLRLNGQGDVGTFGGKRGDIMLRFLVRAMFDVTLLHVAVLSQNAVPRYRSTQKIHSPGAEVMCTPRYLLGTQMLFWGLSLMCRPYEALHQLKSLLGLSMGP